MRILVLNGSPKGANSITLQTVLYLQQHFPKHTWEIQHVGQRIRALERDLSPVREAIERADLVLFSYPVYTFLAPSQLHRLIELLKEQGISLQGKAATQITTSKHFYDTTAHRYIQDNCQEMGAHCIRGLSADMDDLLTEKGQQQAKDFFRYVHWSIRHGLYEPDITPQPSSPARKSVTVPAVKREKKPGDVVIVTDCEADNTQLQAMIDRFCAVFPYPTRVLNIREYPMQGGCLGCFRCAVTGQCVYKDGFDEFLRREIQTAQAMVFAFTVRDHSMGARFKMYNDREFCNGHRTVTMGAPIGYLVSGDYSRETNLQTVLEARAQVGGNFLAGVATDEQDPDRSIDGMAKTLCYALSHKLSQPQNFYGVGGMKIFRDLIWQMQGMMKADHRFFKAHGQYDFPQKKLGRMLGMYAVGALLSSPQIVAKMGNKMNEGMLMPYQKVLNKK